MGLLVSGQWQDTWYDTSSTGGKFVRQASQFRNWVTPDGAPGPSGRGGFAAESGRYHLYVSLACPWAHRTLIMRELKSLTAHISVSVVDPLMLEHGWSFNESYPDELFASEHLYDIYLKADATYTGRVTVPVLWDKAANTIVSNESAEIMRMLNSAFNHITGNQDDYHPEPLREDIEAINARVYDNFNNGVYRAGFATSQDAYLRAFEDVFATLDWLEDLLSKQRYLAGAPITEADWRLFTTLIRFDAVCFGHFKCNRHMIKEYPNVYSYLRELFQVPGIAETVNLPYIKQHYYGSHRTINPTGVVPAGQEDPSTFMHPHNRDHLSATAA